MHACARADKAFIDSQTREESPRRRERLEAFARLGVVLCGFHRVACACRLYGWLAPHTTREDVRRAGLRSLTSSCMEWRKESRSIFSHSSWYSSSEYITHPATQFSEVAKLESCGGIDGRWHLEDHAENDLASAAYGCCACTARVRPIYARGAGSSSAQRPDTGPMETAVPRFTRGTKIARLFLHMWRVVHLLRGMPMFVQRFVDSRCYLGAPTSGSLAHNVCSAAGAVRTRTQ